MKNEIFGKLSEDGKTAELYIYGDIVSEDWRWFDNEVSSALVLSELEKESIEQIDVFINSFGGSVFEGLTIYSILKRQKAKVNVFIDGIAASIASVIALAGDTVTMYKHSMMMVHNCWSIAYGNANDLRETAKDLDKIMDSINEVYMGKFSGSLEELKELLDNESYLSATDCLNYGFCDSIVEGKDVNAKMQMEAIKTLVSKTNVDYSAFAQSNPLGSAEVIASEDETVLIQPQNRFFKKQGGN